MNFITEFRKLLNTSEDGGKGYHLKELTHLGFNVPRGIVIGASFYANNYPKPPQFNFDNEKILEHQALRMQEKIKATPLSKEFMKDIRQRLQSYGQTRFAVRSSSTFEDLASAAFAGQHDTYLNVSLENLETKIKECFASLWQKHAILYRNHQGFSQEDASMAVVIQKMINADSAGVAFSVDPVSGNMNHVLIEANYGIGESVVGGEATTDSWIVDSKDWNIIERRINKKDNFVGIGNDGTEVKSLSEEEGQKPCLNDEQIIEVAKIIKKIELAFMAPYDVEWAFEKGILYILQARPQTTIPVHLTRDESAERYPEPLTPLTWSYAQEAFNNSLEYSLNLMGISLPTRPWFTMQDNYIYGNQNAVRLLGMRRLFRADDLAYLESDFKEIEKNLKWVYELPKTWARDLDRYLLIIGKLSDENFNVFNAKDFQVYFKELFDATNQYFKPNIAISMTQGLLTKALMEYIFGLTGSMDLTQRYLKAIIGGSSTKTAQVNREIYKMAEMAKNNEHLLKILSEGGQSAYKKIEEIKEFVDIFNKFIEDYGHREITFDYYKPTWADAPWVVLDLIYLAATSGKNQDPIKKEYASKEISFKASGEIISKTPREMQYFINQLISLVIEYTNLDDLEHFHTTRVNVLARRAGEVLGQRLVENNQIEEPLDIFFLVKEELELVKEFILSDELKSNIKIRKSQYLRACQTDPKWDLNENEEVLQEESNNSYRGIPGSPGQCEGKIYLVRGPEDFAGMPENSIIVARTTNPAWTPLFYKAKGLITECGGPLSHGAVTARELGLPAVMCIKNALKFFENGQEVMIDGQKGIVVAL